MEFKDVFRFAIQHYKLLILGLILGAVLGVGFSMMSPAPYEATSKILISRNRSDKDSDYGYLTDQQLIQTYAYLLKSSTILDYVNQDIQSKVNPDNVRVSQVPETMMLQITVQDENPQKAAYLANAFSDAMVAQSTELQEERFKIQEEGLQSQIAAVKTQIDDLETQYDARQTVVNRNFINEVDKQILAYRNEILTLQKEIALISTPTNLDQQNYVIERRTKLDEIQPLLTLYQQIRTNLEYLGRPYQSGSEPDDTTLSRLKTTIGQYQDVYLSLINSLENIRLAKVQNRPTVVIIEEASVPKSRASLSFILNPVISGGAGLILAILVGLALQGRKVKITNKQDLLHSLGLDMIGTIPTLSTENILSLEKSGKSGSVDLSPFYDLRAFLEYQRIRNPFRSLLITSFGTEVGKSTVATNLAANYAQGGDRVILMDANFENGDQHNKLNTDNNLGLTDVLFKKKVYSNANLQGTLIKNLLLFPVGKFHPDSLQLLDPQNMRRVLTSAEEVSKLVLIDGQSISNLNTRLMASVVDRVLLVMRSGIYSLDGLEEALKGLSTDREKILGVVLNEEIAAEPDSQKEKTNDSNEVLQKKDELVNAVKGFLRKKRKESPAAAESVDDQNPIIETNFHQTFEKLELSEASPDPSQNFVRKDNEATENFELSSTLKPMAFKEDKKNEKTVSESPRSRKKAREVLTSKSAGGQVENKTEAKSVKEAASLSQKTKIKSTEKVATDFEEFVIQTDSITGVTTDPKPKRKYTKKNPTST